MTKFELYEEEREERRFRERNEALNAELLRSLQTRTREEVFADLLGELTIPLGFASILTARQAEIPTEKSADLLVF